MQAFDLVSKNISQIIPIPIYVGVFVVLLFQVFPRIFIARQRSIGQSTANRPGKDSDTPNGIYDRKPSLSSLVTPDPTFSWRDNPQQIPREIKPGKYFLTMNVRKLDFNDYIIFDKRYLSEYRERQAIISNVGSARIFVAEANDAALDLCEETLMVTVDFLVTRYPSMFHRTERGVLCVDAGEEYDLVTRPWVRHPLETMCLLSGDDCILMRCCNDGVLRVAAVGLVYSLDIDWTSFVGKDLASIHRDARIPFYESAIQKSVDRYFLKLQPDKPVARANWLTQIGPELRNEKFPDEYFRHVSTIPGNTITPETVVDDLYFRVERQAMRKLPSMRGVVFKFHLYATNIWDLELEEGVPRRFAEHIRGLPESVLRQKHCLEYVDCILKVMDLMAERQEKNTTNFHN
ncbi:hypothetical protein V1523DRAFT_417035 [Lipomyces doorenjongii]